MPTDTEVTVYYGPLAWFKSQLGNGDRESLLEITYGLDEANRRHTLVVPGQEPVEEIAVPRPKRVAAESSDFASLSEHVITNFAGLIQSIRPKHLYLHNPPERVHAQLERSFPTTKVERYRYPVVTRDTLIRFNKGFEDHLVGQHTVKDSLLAALYPLTTSGRSKPVVLMFYGPSGVGKTETAQFVNGLLGGTLMRKQFSMFHSDKFASYLFGGEHSEASFARDLLDRESGVILIDEFDKANSIFHSAFYQLFDGGVFEDKNYSVQLGPSLIVCTSNYASEKEIRESLGEALYSRFDALVQFRALLPEQIRQVIDRLVEDRFSKLGDAERDILSPETLKSLLYPSAAKSGNVRKLGKLVDEVISLLLVRHLISERSSESDVTANRDTA